MKFTQNVKRGVAMLLTLAMLVSSGNFGLIFNVFAETGNHSFREPVAVEHIKADAGLDIGGTLIGMHLKHVAVPVRLEQKHIGEAILLAARVRPKFIGGDRAVYNDDLK